MNIPKAIEILTITNYHNPYFTDADRRAANKLGIEALKVVRWNRTHKYPSNALLLPGETEEVSNDQKR